MFRIIGEILPEAVAVAFSPTPIIIVILILMGSRPRVTGLLYMFGWLFSFGVVSILLLAVGTFVYSSTSPQAGPWLGLIILLVGVILVVLAVLQLRNRPPNGTTPDLPSWFNVFSKIGPMGTFMLGVLMAGPSLKNMGLTISAVANIQQGGFDIHHQQTWIILAIFIFLSGISIIIPVAIYMAKGEASEELLNRWKQWLLENSAVLMFAILLLMGFKIIGSGLSSIFK
jgi:hypothetical protein